MDGQKKQLCRIGFFGYLSTQGIFDARSPFGLVRCIFHHCAAHFTGISARRRAPMTHLDQAEEGVVLDTALPKVFAGLP